MTRKIVHIIAEILIFTCVLVLLTPPSTEALTLQTVDGGWSNIMHGGSVHFYDDVASGYGNGQENQVRWGTPAENGQSGLGFTGVASGSTFGPGDVFEIGQLRHFNTPILSGTAADSAQLSLNMAFNDPVGVTEAFDFTFAIDETPNTPGPPASDDIIDFPTASLLRSFSVAGIDYTFELLGFGPSGTLMIDHFRSPEGTTNATKLWGKIESVPSAVPEPAGLLLLGSGLLGVLGLTKKRRMW